MPLLWCAGAFATAMVGALRLRALVSSGALARDGGGDAPAALPAAVGEDAVAVAVAEGTLLEKPAEGVPKGELLGGSAEC